jgi:hypothetical protein
LKNTFYKPKKESFDTIGNFAQRENFAEDAGDGFFAEGEFDEIFTTILTI